MKKALVLTVIIPLLVLLISGRTIAGEAGKPAPITGKVVETMDSGGYTYVCVEKGGKKTWVAMPQMKIEKGKTLSFEPGNEMTNFKSKTLNRTFEKITFSSGPVK